MALGTGETVVSRRQIIRSCKARGWTVQPDALKAIENSVLLTKVGDYDVEGYDDDDDDDDATRRWSSLFESFTQHIQKNHSNLRTITEHVWNDFVQKQHDDENGGIRTITGTAEAVHVQVINAFDTPKLVFEVMRKQFQVLCSSNNSNKWSLFGTAEDKINMLAQRYALIHQRILRHELFRTSDLHRSTRITASSGGPLKITPIESLLGAKGTESTSSLHLILILGILLQIEEGVYYFEDPTGQVPVSFQQAVVTDASFITEHSILLVEGHFQDGILHVHRLGQPLQESRKTAIRSIQQQVSHPHYALPKITNTSSSLDMSFVILQDVHVDQPRILQQLEGLFATYENYSLDRLPLFVLTGNFCSPHVVSATQPAALYQLVKSAVDELCTLIARFPRLAAHAHFCFVPGPNDSLCRVLPFPPLPQTNNNNNNNRAVVAHCHWASNPCRIRWNHKEMVVFRYDLLPLLQQHQIRLPFSSSTSGDGGGEDDPTESLRLPHCRLLKTVLDQGHLMPLAASVPVYWNYSHALSLYPLPDCLVVSSSSSGNSARPEYEQYWDCHVIQTTAMSPHGAYAIYRPNGSVGGGVDIDPDNSSSASVDSHDDSDNVVEFGTLGEVDVGSAP